VRVAIANFSPPIPQRMDFAAAWAAYEPPPPPPTRLGLFEQPVGWGFHILALGVLLLDRGTADRVEFWDYQPDRATTYLPNGVLRLHFWNDADVRAYVARTGWPDLFVNYGRHGARILRLLAGRSFRVDVPCLRAGMRRHLDFGADCYLVDDERWLGARARLYVPVVNTRKIAPAERTTERDFVYLASFYPSKRHDLLLDAVRGTSLTGHLHPVPNGALDLAGANVTTSDWNERDVLDVLTTSRIAVYPGDDTSNPAAMWECVAAGLPIVVNAAIRGGRHLVVPGVTGELARESEFRDVMLRTLERRATYRPRAHFEAHWEPLGVLDRYFAFFR
jgi:glycosyltransferase involved in cell wall biosynthesis